jgi:CRISPR-associated protein Csd1
MILHALKDYYDRKAADPKSTIAPPGWEWKELPFLVLLNAQGHAVNIEDTRAFEGKRLRAKRFLVPQSVKRARGAKANLLWDNPDYALALNVKGDETETAMKHQLFIDRIHDEQLADIPEIATVLAFLARPGLKESLLSLGAEIYEELTKASFISFKIAGQLEPVFRCSAVVERLNVATTPEFTGSFCLISGKPDVIDPTHPAIKGVRGANSTGGNIVSFNARAFCSYGKSQGANSPVGKIASFAYTTALNALLDKDSKQKIQVGDASTVFWSSRESALEESFADFFEEPPKDDPDRLSNAVAALYQAIDSGSLPADKDDNHFYILGLAPNAARLAVRFWHHSTVKELATHIRAYFEDTRIVHGARDPEDLSLWRLLVATAAQGKSENINPKLAGDTMRCILTGSPLPETLLQATLLRTKAEREVSYPRAKLIKACLNRKSKERKLAVSLDYENTNVAYRLGRLFAVLEKIQQEANPGINATIRDKFYASASFTPSTVFGSLMRLKNHHLAKLENPGRRIYFERLLGEIISEVPEFPAHLSLDDQGRFAIGYYHQTQDLWTKKLDKQENA